MLVNHRKGLHCRGDAAFLLTLACAAIATTTVRAQATQTPYSWQHGLSLEGVPVMQLSPVNPSAAVHVPATNHVVALSPKGFEPFGTRDAGGWTRAGAAGRLWQLLIHSPGAASHMMLLRDVALPAGSELYIYAPAAHSSERHACLHSCHRYTAADVPAGGSITVPPVDGDSVMLEVYQADGAAAEPAHMFVVSAVMQGLADTTNCAPPSATPHTAASRRLHFLDTVASGAAFPRLVDSAAGSLIGSLSNTTIRDAAAPCTPNVQCDPTWSQQASLAVVNIYAIGAGVDGQTQVQSCSGAMLKAADKRNYVLTSSLCGAFVGTNGSVLLDNTDPTQYGNWLVVFNYENPCSVSTLPPITNVKQGLALRLLEKKADGMVLEFPGALPSAFAIFQAGVDARPNIDTPAVVGIHHNGGGIKRISYANSSVPGAGMTSGISTADRVFGSRNPANFLRVNWGTGAAVGGSVGSPLFDASGQRVIGMLSEGASSCDRSACQVPGTNCTTANGYAYYGRMSVMWQNGLRELLQSPPAAAAPANPISAISARRKVLQYGNPSADPYAVSSPTTVPNAPANPATTRPVTTAAGTPSGAPTSGSGSAPSPAAATGSAALLADTVSTDGSELGRNSTGVYTLPIVLRLNADDTNFSNLSVAISQQPDPKELITAQLSILPVTGTPLNITTAITVTPTRLYFTAANWTNAAVVTVARPMNLVIPDSGLLRFDVTIALLSNSTDDELIALHTVRGVIVPRSQPAVENRPVSVGILPYRSQGSLTPALANGRAVFLHVPPSNVVVDTQICLAPGYISNIQVVIYEDLGAAWSQGRPPINSSDPNCIILSALSWAGGVPYHVIVSDSEDLNALLPITAVPSFLLQTSQAKG